MYLELNNILSELKIKKKELSENVLHFKYQQYLTNRLNGITSFSEEEKEKIYNYLCDKGYKGDIEGLFATADVEVEPTNRFSQILKDEMKKKGMTIEKLQEELDLQENIKVSTVTISNWRNGKISGYPKPEICIALCKILDIDMIYFFNDVFTLQDANSTFDYELSNGGFRETINIEGWKRAEAMYKSIIQYTIDDDKSLRSYEKVLKDYKVRRIVEDVLDTLMNKFSSFLQTALDDSDKLLNGSQEIVITDGEIVNYVYVDENGVEGGDRIDLDLNNLQQYMDSFTKSVFDRKKLQPITLQEYDWEIATYLTHQREQLKKAIDDLGKRKGTK